jgi:hypothetical protein
MNSNLQKWREERRRNKSDSSDQWGIVYTEELHNL